ncbi:MAG TPA: zinc ribbon domain-containing protein [Thermoplasmata archaeon]|nr:zinc ribbon domain-containing protein [Thermoplasmata archaeon]HEV2428971.1 zinc ribbon domain-containing protein [Thermoplasmata archaeon]
MFCPNCRASLPDGSKFCLSCGAPMPSAGGAAAPAVSPPAAPAPSMAEPSAQSLKCPSCGAGLHVVFGEMVITCEYCGASVSLGGAGWKAINKHTLLLPKVTEGDQALGIVRQYMDQGFLHRKAFEESKVVEQKLTFVPFWIVPVSATTNFTYTDVGVSVGSTVGSIAAAELLGSALGGNRRGGGIVAFPVMTGSPVNATRQDTVSGQYEFPVVAVKGMSEYQPKDYKFQLSDRSFFDRKAIPSGAPVLNGDLGEDAAQHAAKAFVTQLQTEEAHKKHYMVSQLTSNLEVSEAELLHVPVWYYLLEHKGQKTIILIDSHAGAVMRTVA